MQEALERGMANRTVMVIAHRLSTIKNADVIAVMKNGKIAEVGRLDSLEKINFTVIRPALYVDKEVGGANFTLLCISVTANRLSSLWIFYRDDNRVNSRSHTSVFLVGNSALIWATPKNKVGSSKIT